MTPPDEIEQIQQEIQEAEVSLRIAEAKVDTLARIRNMLLAQLVDGA